MNSQLYDKSIIKLDSINAKVCLPRSRDFYDHIDNSDGSAKLLIGLLGGSNLGFSGTGSIAKIHMTKKILSQTNLIFDGTETLRGPNNNIIKINSSIGGLIVNE